MLASEAFHIDWLSGGALIHDDGYFDIRFNYTNEFDTTHHSPKLAKKYLKVK
jgi:hypothetical protein